MGDAYACDVHISICMSYRICMSYTHMCVSYTHVNALDVSKI